MTSNTRNVDSKTLAVFKAIRKTNKKAAYDYINFAHVRASIEKASYRAETSGTTGGEMAKQSEGQAIVQTDNPVSVHTDGLEYH